ncbi:helix-turn-helix transcriptional regulator [Polaromonas sp.]|uniref:helix-turn-helix transcriptional regulator n=1 Tax=Polaromonas sp. TaxID=1869339 RepID=UPI003BB5C5FF
MAKNDKKSAVIRQWEMMRMLTVSRSDSQQGGRWDKASEIAEKLTEKGYAVSVRTVQRDLKELSEIFPIELNDHNARDYGWRWRKGANLAIPGMSVSEALAMRLVQTHLKPLLPASMLNGLQGVFSLAQSKLDNVDPHNKHHAQNWLGKVHVVPPAQPMLPPKVNEAVQAAVYQAVLEDRPVGASYRSLHSKQTRALVLHPLGLIMRGAVTYLVASAWDYAEARLYALHRFSQVEVLDTAIKPPEGFSLEAAMAAGLAEFASQGESIQLQLRCTKWVAGYLAETPLAADQKMEPAADGRVQLTATVNDTWQLHWWLLGQCH